MSAEKRAETREVAPRRRRSTEGRGGLIGLLTPGTLWIVVFFLLPLVFVAVSSFMSRGPGGQPVQPWTLDQYERTFTTFGPVLWRSLRIALVATLFCLLLGYPAAFFISRRRNPGVRVMLLVGVINVLVSLIGQGMTMPLLISRVNMGGEEWSGEGAEH